MRLQRAPARPDALGAGLALGLGLLTKATAYVLALPLLAAWLVAGPSRVRRAALWVIPIVAASALALNGAHYARNIQLYGHPLGPGHEGPLPGLFRYTVDTLSPTSVVSGVLRNLGLHLGVPSHRVTDGIGGWLDSLIRRVGADPNDPATTWTGSSFHVPRANRHESTAGNPIHLLLVSPRCRR